MACLWLQSYQFWYIVVWTVIFYEIESLHLVVADTFNVHFLPGSSDRTVDKNFAAAAIGVENYITAHPNSTIFANHEVR